MLMGEHAVLHGSLSLIMAVNRRIHVEISTLPQREINITSELACHSSSLDAFTQHPRLNYVCQLISHYLPQIQHGFSLTINSEFDHRLGLGSSAAVCSATAAALYAWLHGQPAPHALLLEQVRQVTGTSGADAAACIAGGLVAYRQQPAYWQKLSRQLDITVLYSGSKQTTENVVHSVEQQHDQQPIQYANYYRQINQLTEQAYLHLSQSKGLAACAELCCKHQMIMQNMQLDSPRLKQLRSIMQQYPSIKACKISGAGRGDCIFGIGKLSMAERLNCQLQIQAYPGAQLLDLHAEPQGVQYHAI